MLATKLSFSGGKLNFMTLSCGGVYVGVCGAGGGLSEPANSPLGVDFAESGSTSCPPQSPPTAKQATLAPATPGMVSRSSPYVAHR